jgi:hypothetical protein
MQILTPLLFEGLLPIPPVVLQEATEQINSKIAAKWYLQLLQMRKFVDNSQKDKQAIIDTAFQKLHTKIDSEIRRAANDLIKLPEKQSEERVWWIPFINDVYPFEEVNYKICLNKTTEKKLELLCFVPSDVLYLKKNETAVPSISGDDCDYGQKGYEEENIKYFFEQTIYEFKDQIIRDMTNMRYGFEHVAEYFDDPEYNTGLKFVKSLIKGKDLTNFKMEDAPVLWGFNYNLKLTPELFKHWQIGNNPNDVSQEDIEKLKYRNDLQKIHFRIQFLKKDEPSPTSSAGERYSGLYSGHRLNGGDPKLPGWFAVDIVVPYLSFKALLQKEDIEETLRDINTTIEHELGHWTQDILQKMKTGKFVNKAAVEGQKGYKFGIQSKSLQNKKNSNGFYIKDKMVHGERDVEFYTNLINSKNYIEHYLEQMIEIDHRSNKDILNKFKELVGYNVFKRNFSMAEPRMEALRDSNKLKWMKAIKLLYNYFSTRQFFNRSDAKPD